MSSSESENLSVKIVTADYYLHKPLSDLGDQCYSAFRSSPVYRVPVIRIFGPTSKGVKTCLHVHGVFPYIFVPNWNDEIGGKELYNFAANLDKAINTSFAHSNSKSSHVHKITSVSGMPFYGYHESERSFLKIEFYNPAIVKRASDLLLNGAVLNTIFQPHEAHIPYILQFFIDNNLYGMNSITFSGYKVRKNDTQDEFRLDESIISSYSRVCQQSYSSLEIDITISNLCNVSSSEENIPNNPGLALIWEDEKKRRRFNQKSSQITPNESQQRPEKPVTRTENYFREKLIQKLQAIKDNATCMDIDNDETPSFNSTYEELNTQSKSLLEILQSLAGQQEKSKETMDSGSSSPSLVYSDDENNAADVSLITSQPLLKFNAEDDSILGNNFSDDENEIDDHDHRALSQPINYSRHQMSSSDDSDAEAKEIPQLDGAYDTKSTKKSATKKAKPAPSRKKVIKLSSMNQNQDDPTYKRTYNLRSQAKSTKESFKKVNFQPRAFQIVLNKLEPPKILKISPKKPYPRLNIDTQKSPRSNSSRSSQDNIDLSLKVSKPSVHQLPTESSEESLPSLSEARNESVSVPDNSSVKFSKPESNNNVLLYKEPILVIPRLSDELSNRPASLPEPRTSDKSALLPASRSRNEFASSFTESPSKTTHKSADSSLQKSDRKIYPQLEISIKKSPRSSQKFVLDDALSSRGVATLQGLKKRKINFGEGENDSSKSKESIQNADLISPRWKKSLKRRKKDDTSFKIGNSFSLLGFRNSKKDQSAEKGCKKFTSLDSLTNSCEMNSQAYSLRLTGTECSSIISGGLEKSNYENQSTEMDALQISEDEDAETEVENDREPLMESDDESLLAIPLDATQNDELHTRSTTKLSQSTFAKCPVLKLPRLDPNTMNDSISGSFHEGSSIKLNISESIEDDVTSLSKLIENSNLTTSILEQNSESDLKHESSNMPSQAAKSQPNIDLSISDFIEKVVPNSKEENSITISQSTTSLSENESKPIKVPKKPAIKKKSLGIRIRKNTKQSASSSKSKQNPPEALSKTDDDRLVEKLPMILVDQEDGQNGKGDQNLATSSDLYPDSNIELHVSCTFDSVPQNSTNEVKTSNVTKNMNLGNSHQNISNLKDTICDKNVVKNTTELSLPPFESSQLELDIFQFCSESVEDLAKETCNDERWPIVSINENPVNQMDKVLSSSEISKESNAAVSTEQKLIENENSNSSRSLLSDEILGKANTFLSDSAIGDNDAVYSQEIPFEENPLMDENLISSQSIFNDEPPIESNFLNLAETSFDDNDLFYSQGVSSAQKSQQLIDDTDTYFSQIDPTEPTNNLNENLIASPSFFDDEFLYGSAPKVPDSSVQLKCTSNISLSQLSSPVETSRNPNDIVDDDGSNDSLLNVIDSLTPRTKEALNRNLNSFEGDNLPASISQQNNIFDDRVTLAEPNQQPSDGTSENKHSDFKNPSENYSKQSKSLEESSPNILNKSSYSLNLCLSSSTATRGPAHEAILFEEDSFELDFPPLNESESVKKTPTMDKVLLNHSFWDSMNSEEVSQEDNEIQSFYHNQTVNPAHITIIRDIAEDDDSSPIAKSLTPESQTSNEILSFYGSQSPDSMICSISEDLLKQTETKLSTPIVESTTSRTKRGPSPVVSHSTPGSSSTTKKTPSPLYTPILKKLMIKKVNEKDKRRISSQRFRAEPFLPEIVEENESDKNTTLSLPLELEYDTSKVDGKSVLNTSKTSNCSGASYQIDGASFENTCGFKMNLENLQDIKTDKQFQFITLISLEVFAQTRGDLKPDPEYDPITCLFYSIHHDAPDVPFLVSGIIVVSEDSLSSDLERFKCEKTVISSEVELFDVFLALIRKWDPDMFIGYEVEMLSWGFLIQRGHFLGRNLSHELSRVRETKQNEPIEKAPYVDDDYSNEIKLTGRIVLNVWRLMRHEVNLQSYTFENILFHVLHQRVPYHDFKFLTDCWKNNFKKWIVVDYFLFRAESNITLLQQLDFICRTSELARLFGIQFYEVLSRGSQFRVESMMLRLAKTQNYVAVSPSVKQRAHMRAPESLPLIMEPESKFYTDPLIVLDFQSLYPSIIIAYNYCFSTCLGRIDSLGQNEPFHFGCVEHTVPGDLLVKLENSLNLSPAGVAFVDKSIRKGILPSMLEEILETRLMVKKSMKENKNNSILKRVLHARQLGLKLIANVTYGYTSANFSGRMPCMEIADSVVSKGRETLERAIELVNGTGKWGARVVYGDTDSLFVLVPNRSKEEAFRIGSEIANAVTNQNPKPVKLKLEKVYTASILQTKKRYVGYMYESPDQEKPTYDAKGIETVRRDGCPAISKILEKSLKLLFETKNVHTVKQYVQRQFTKLISGRISVQELTFAREYRGLNNYKPAACVPALQLAKQALLKDRRAEPRVKERVRYVIVTGAPGVPLIRLVRTPREFIDTPGSLINTEYYITRAIIPALERCFTLMNVSVQAWYKEMPKKQKLNLPIDHEFRNKAFKKTTISHYFSSSKCISCSKVAGGSVCRECEHKPQRLALILGNMINQWQHKRNNVAKICRSCCGRNEPIGCSSLDCPIYYLFRQTDHDAEQVRYAENLKREYLYF